MRAIILLLTALLAGPAFGQGFSGGGGAGSGATANTLPSAQALSGTDGVIVVQPSNLAAPNALALAGPDQVGSYLAANPGRRATQLANATLILDTTLFAKTVLVTQATTIQAPATFGNLGGAGGDGFWMRVLNPDGYLLTFASNGSNTIVVPGNLTSSSLAGVYEFYASTAGGSGRIVAKLPGGSGSTIATAFTTALSATSGNVGVPVTQTLTPSGVWPPSVTATPGATGCSGAWSPTSSTPTGGGSTPAAFVFTPSSAGSCSLTASATGLTNTSGARAYTANTTPTTISAVLPQVIGTVSAGLIYNVSYAGGWNPGSITATIDGSAATISANSAGSGGVGTITVACPATAGIHTLALSGAGSASTDLFCNSASPNAYMAQHAYSLATPVTAVCGNCNDLTYILTGDGTHNGTWMAQNTVTSGTTPGNLSQVLMGWTTNPAVPPAAQFPGSTSHTNRNSLGTVQSGGQFSYFYSGSNWPYIWTTGSWYPVLLITDAGGNQFMISHPTPVVAN